MRSNIEIVSASAGSGKTYRLAKILLDALKSGEVRPEAIVAVNDLGPGGETWTLATLTFAKQRLYAHTMKEIICIEAGSNDGSSEK